MSDIEGVSGGDVDDRRMDIQEGGGTSTVEISGEAAIAGEEEARVTTTLNTLTTIVTTITAAIVSK